MDFDNNGFIISDSFYKAEYETPNYSIYDFYEIGSWNIEVIKKYEQITIVELLVYFNELLKACPWLNVKRERISKKPNRPPFANKQCYIDFNISELRNVNLNDNIEIYAGFFECNFSMLYHGNVISMSHKDQVTIYPSFDDEYKTLAFSLDFTMDMFFHNPSRQPDVTLPYEYVKFNRDRLSKSLKAIDESGIFIIKNFESDFYPNEITKYGFQDFPH